MENNNSSGSSVCTKIRQTLASNPAFGAIKRISILDHEPKPVTTKTSSAQTKPHTPPHHKHHKEASGAIPIKFDYSAPNGNKAVSTVPKGASAHVGNSERATKVAAKVELEPQPQYVPIQGKHPKKEGVQGHLGAQHVHVVHSEHHQGKKPEDINDTFSDFIKRAKGKISRTVTNIGWRQSNYPAAEPDHEGHVTNKNESHNKDHFSEFIHRAKKKIRTTTMVRKTGSIRRD